jgi:hypothetical protein
MLLSDGAEFLPKRRQDPEKDRKDNELKWLLWGRVAANYAISVMKRE